MFVTNSVEETINFGKKIGENIFEGACICLDGDLGSGKTHLTKGIAIGMNIREDITSPTFTIVQEYDSVIDMYHFDMYRLENIDELYAIGFEDYLKNNQVIIIEWSENVKEALPNDRLEIFIEYTSVENERNIKMKALGEKSLRLLNILTKD